MDQGAELPELGADQLDLRRPESRPAWRWTPRRRPALGVRATAVPTWLFILIGAAIGPAGLNILSPRVLTQTRALTWVALAIIGVFVGLAVTARGSQSTARALASGGIIALLTSILVAAGLYLLLTGARIPVPGDVFAASMLIGLCASVSAALQVYDDTSVELRRAVHLADLDDVPLLVLGVAIVAGLAGDAAAVRLSMTVAAGAAIGFAGCLLFEGADGSERGMFVTAAVLLLAGIGAYLGTSPLVSGAVAAIVWVRVPGRADRITARDLSTLQHPLMALLLIIAGASVQWNAVTLWVAAYVVVLRFASKLLASVLLARLASVSPALLATVLLQPGIMGIALSVNAAQLLGDDYAWIVSAVTAAAVVSEMLAAFLPHLRETPS